MKNPFESPGRVFMKGPGVRKHVSNLQFCDDDVALDVVDSENVLF